jgi:hypothetical protein
VVEGKPSAVTRWAVDLGPDVGARSSSGVGGTGTFAVDLEWNFVYVAPVPVLTGLERLNQRMPGLVEVGRGVAVR